MRRRPFPILSVERPFYLCGCRGRRRNWIGRRIQVPRTLSDDRQDARASPQCPAPDHQSWWRDLMDRSPRHARAWVLGTVR